MIMEFYVDIQNIMKIGYETYLEMFLRSVLKILGSLSERTYFGQNKNGGHVKVFSKDFLLKINQINTNTVDNRLGYNALSKEICKFRLIVFIMSENPSLIRSSQTLPLRRPDPYVYT